MTSNPIHNHNGISQLPLTAILRTLTTIRTALASLLANKTTAQCQKTSFEAAAAASALFTVLSLWCRSIIHLHRQLKIFKAAIRCSVDGELTLADTASEVDLLDIAAVVGGRSCLEVGRSCVLNQDIVLAAEILGVWYYACCG